MIVKAYQRASVSPGGKVSTSRKVSPGGDSAGFLHHFYTTVAQSIKYRLKTHHTQVDRGVCLRYWMVIERSQSFIQIVFLELKKKKKVHFIN